CKFCNPSQTGLQRRSGIVYIVSIKAETHFQSKCVAGCKTNWFNVKIFSSIKKLVPVLFHFVVFAIYLKSTAACITCRADDYVFNSTKIRNFKVVEFYG